MKNNIKNSRFTMTHRGLHWIMAVAMTVLFITGFLRMTWMNKNRIIDVITEKTPATSISKDVMTNIAKAIRAPMWEWHVIFAYVMVIAFVARIIYMLVKGIKFPNPFKNNQSFKARLQGFTYIYFYAFVLINVVTGICLKFSLLSAWKEGIEATHKFGIYWFPVFLLLHFAGIAIAEHTNERGVVSKMIGGESEIKN